MIKYRVWLGKIEPKEVSRETAQTIWYKHHYFNNVSKVNTVTEIQERKSGNYLQWFDTFEEAKEGIIADLRKDITSYFEKIEYLQKRLDEVLTLKEEECLNQI